MPDEGGFILNSKGYGSNIHGFSVLVNSTVEVDALATLEIMSALCSDACGSGCTSDNPTGITTSQSKVFLLLFSALKKSSVVYYVKLYSHTAALLDDWGVFKDYLVITQFNTGQVKLIKPLRFVVSPVIIPLTLELSSGTRSRQLPVLTPESPKSSHDSQFKCLKLLKLNGRGKKCTTITVTPFSFLLHLSLFSSK